MKDVTKFGAYNMLQ